MHVTGLGRTWRVPLHAWTARRHKRLTNALIGVDLGTTNSSIAILGTSGPEIVPDIQGRKSVPSEVVWVNRKELRVVDKDHTRGADPVLGSFKRIIGLRCEEISDAVKDSLVFSVKPSDDGFECMVCCDGCMISPVKLSSTVLKHLMASPKIELYENTNGGIEGAVVAVPAHFSVSQKQATILAAEQAGIEKVHLLQEPVAAALAYGIDGGSDGETVLVFDWGGGTFDVSVLQAFEGIMEILGTDGNQFLGGDDIDRLLFDYFCSTFSKTLKPSLDLYKRCRIAKERLALDEQSEISLGGNHILTLSRNDLEIICHPLFQKIAIVFDRIGKDLFIEWNNCPFESIGPDFTRSSRSGAVKTDPWAPPPRKITKVVLVGQITRLPMVVEYVKRVTGVDPCCSVDPGEAVAIGAATQAGILEGSIGSVELMDGSYSIDLHDRATGFSNWQP